MSYQARTRRLPNAEELVVSKRAWSRENSYWLDAVVSIDAEFENGMLSRYEVSRIESY